jgi:hypothetical protein
MKKLMLKKILIGFSFLFILPVADGTASDYEEQLMKLVTALHPGSKISWDQAVLAEDGSRLTINNLLIIREPVKASRTDKHGEPVSGQEEKAPFNRRINIKRIVLEKPNLRLGLDEGAALLAEKVSLYGLSWQSAGRNGLTLLIKEMMLAELNGPWQDFIYGSGRRPDQAQLIARLASIQVKSAQARAMVLETEEHGAILIESARSGRAGLFTVPDKILLQTVRVLPFLPSDRGSLSIDEITLSYDFLQPLLALGRRNPERHEDAGWFTGSPFNLSLRLERVGAGSYEKDIFTVKNISLEYKNASRLSSRLAVNDFRLNHDWLIRFDREMALAFKGKPLRFTLESFSEYEPGRVGPFRFSLNLPALARLEMEGQLGYNFAAADLMPGTDDWLGLMKRTWQNLLVRQFSLRYDDKGLTEALLTYSSEETGQSVQQLRRAAADNLRALDGEEEKGFRRDVYLALARLVLHSGRLSLKVEAPLPLPLTDLLEKLPEAGRGGSQIKYKVN